ncbi:hypothetical protein ACFSTC_02020 [Nonomuraea ferruginea]
MARVRLGFSPILPTIASFLLATLWGLSVFAGWGLEAFCGGSSPSCVQRLAVFSSVSGLFAAVAACLTVAAWALPSGAAGRADVHPVHGAERGLVDRRGGAAVPRRAAGEVNTPRKRRTYNEMPQKSGHTRWHCRIIGYVAAGFGCGGVRTQ